MSEQIPTIEVEVKIEGCMVEYRPKGTAMWVFASRKSHIDIAARELLKPEVPDELEKLRQQMRDARHLGDEGHARVAIAFAVKLARRVHHRCGADIIMAEGKRVCSTCEDIAELEAAGGGA